MDECGAKLARSRLKNRKRMQYRFHLDLRSCLACILENTAVINSFPFGILFLFVWVFFEAYTFKVNSILREGVGLTGFELKFLHLYAEIALDWEG